MKFGVYRTLATMGILLKTLGVALPKEVSRKPNTFQQLNRRF